MTKTISLAGEWDFCIDLEKKGLQSEFFAAAFSDRIVLPGIVSLAGKSPLFPRKEIGSLTDPHLYEGWAWFSRIVSFPESPAGEIELVLERTRTTRVWLDGIEAGTENSLCTPHRYRLPGLRVAGSHRLTILVDNSSCPVKGGHMTSPDTQTNWNGITGRIELSLLPALRVDDVVLSPDAALRKLGVRCRLATPRTEKGQRAQTTFPGIIRVLDIEETVVQSIPFAFQSGINDFTIDLAESVERWSEHAPVLYALEILPEGSTDRSRTDFGLRDFKATGRYFTINGERAFLRGKHDGLVFPLTGFAPTDVESWLTVLSQAKQYGINHYRFHTCCPPEAAFIAADRLGFYLQPELPFWGTITAEGEANHDAAGQAFLIREGLRILDEFANHPSFVMMSLGNELWGNQNRLNEILKTLKAHDSRPLFTQGSNNFQFCPVLLENDDFFSGVRFSRDRLFRGSYAMCDAPQGHIQTAAPATTHSYDRLIRPTTAAPGFAQGGEIEIQFGTGTKKVSAEAADEIVPTVPVVSHEIGQYAMAPDFSEIPKYVGALKPYNLEEFRRRFENAGLIPKADAFFRASGRFAAECYKAEIETALRSDELAGFQLLDLQDFPGQGTALVGILNAFMESKGLITAAAWREFCADTVLLAEFGTFTPLAESEQLVIVKLARYRPGTTGPASVRVTLSAPAEAATAENPATAPFSSTVEFPVETSIGQGVFTLGQATVRIPATARPRAFELSISLECADGKEPVRNRYEWWVAPPVQDSRAVCIETSNPEKALDHLNAGETVLFFPGSLTEENSIEGTFCTDFWCYPMFRSISESMKKPVPVGTLGLLIERDHPVFADFPTHKWSSPQWYDMVSSARALILDGTDIEPIVWDIDNFERCKRLGFLFEARVGAGTAFVSTIPLPELKNSGPARWLLRGIRRYLASAAPDPKVRLSERQFRALSGVD